MTQNKELTTNDLEKTLSLKIQEINSLKAQNGRLIERLQEQVDQTSANAIQKEIIHKELIQIANAISDLNRQGQIKKIAVEKISLKINELDAKIIENQKQAASEYGKLVTAAVNDELEQFKLDLIKIQTRETRIEKNLHELSEQVANTNRALSILLKNILKSDQIPNVTYTSDDRNNDNQTINEDDYRKIADEFKSEFKGNDEDIQVIFRLLSEKNPNPQNINEST